MSNEDLRICVLHRGWVLVGKYSRDGEGFLLYSIGLNGVDDGGLAETEEDGKKLNPGTDDVTWRCAR